MFRLSLCVPDETVNYIKNPNCRYDTTDYNALGATLTRTLDYARFSVASLKVVTAGTAIREGFFYRVNALQGISGPLTASAYVIGTGVVRLRLIDNPTGKEWVSETATLRSDRWTRLSASGVITGSNDVRLYVETNEGAAKARTFYAGGLQMERKAYMTTFCDGDQPGCRWNGIYHASSSQRAGDTRAGGRWVQMGGDGREEEDLYITVVGGLGMAPIVNNIQPFALAPGSYFQNKKITDRIITLTFHAKHKTDERGNSISLDRLHELRQLLIDWIKPDRTGGDEDILFEYDDGNLPLYFRARYDGGLEGEWDVRNQWVNSFPLRLLGVEPFLFENNQAAQQLDFQESIFSNFVLARLNGVWNQLNHGFNDNAFTLAVGPRGEVYAGGLFSTANNNAAAIQPNIPARVAYWDGDKWVAIANTIDSGFISGLAVGPDGSVYAGGSFTTIGGVAANRIAKWNGTSWSALGTGLNGTCYDILVDKNGHVYACGTFTTAGGVSCARVARWDGTKWNRLGQYGGVNNDVDKMALTQDGRLLYIGGVFTDENGNPGSGLNRVAEYNIETGLFSAMGSGITSTAAHVFAVKVSDDGVVYIGGNFYASGSVTVNNVAKWDGKAWTAMGEGFNFDGDATTNTSVQTLSIFEDGTLLAGGYFNRSGKDEIFGIAYWNGSTWHPFDATLKDGFTANNYVRDSLIHPMTGDVFLALNFGAGGGTGKNVLCAGITLVNSPPSGAETYPVLYLKGQGSLYRIENQTTKKSILLNLDINNNEEVFFDFGRGTIESTVRGSLLWAMLPGSDFRAFTLIPGENKLACFMIDDVNAQMSIQFTPRHWGADATG